MMPVQLRIITHDRHHTEAPLTGPLGGRALQGTMQHPRFDPLAFPDHCVSF